MKHILVTGGAGFIGSAFVRYMLRTHEDIRVVNYDALTYAGNLENLQSVENDSRYTFVKGDIGDKQLLKETFGQHDIDTVVNFAAESHNDRGVIDPSIFLKTNVLGTQQLLQACREAGMSRIHHISTCEVFGDLALDATNAFSENDPYHPRTPYNASKASSDHVVMSYFHTFGLPITISRCCNNYGPYQFPEKVIPLFATNALDDTPLPLMKSSQNRREWIHADDHSAAVDVILQKGVIGETYNIGTGIEKSVEDIADVVLTTLDKPSTLKQYVTDRPGHDRRYLLDSSKLRRELGWQPTIDFSQGICDTITWYRDNRNWWERIKNGNYQEYYKAYYQNVLGAKVTY